VSSTLVIYNPAAGRGRVQAHWLQVESALRQAGVEFEAVATRAPLDAMAIAERAAGSYPAVVSVGGDGTLHEIVNGLLRASGEGETVAVGMVPLGNGDDFAKVIPPETPVGGKPFDWRAAVDKIAGGQTQLFDVGRITGDQPLPGIGDGPQHFMNSMDVGFGALGSHNYRSVPSFLTGFSAYLAAVLKTLVDYPTLNLRIQLDDQPPFEQPSTMTAVMNGRCFGNGFWVCPAARPDDGLLDVLVAQAVSRLTILRLIPKIMRGTHTHEPVLRLFQARRVSIESHEPLVVEADGEFPYTQAHRLQVDILPKKLRVIV
jgi:YegS/Rv2252/BmrU family lipid kinase